MVITNGMIRSCSKSQRVFSGGFAVVVVVPWLVLVVVIWLYPPLKPVQSQPNHHTARMNAISAAIIPIVRSQCFLMYCHHERNLAPIASPLLTILCLVYQTE